MSGLRLLPILLFALSSLFVLKSIDLLGRIGVEIGGPPPAYAGADVTDVRSMPEDLTGTVTKKEPAPAPAAPLPAPADAAKPAGGDQPGASEGAAPAQGKPVETAPPLIPLGGSSPSERALLERLQQRREQLDQQGRELDMRENLLKAAEKRIEERIGELKQLEASVGTAQQRQDDAEQSRMKSLVIMYEAMKPKDAARIFDKLDMAILVDVANAMKPQKLADVIAAMDSDAAQRLTVALANRGAAKPAQGTPEQPALDLPKIEGKPPQG
jgi:flagellar motility protein MotE (MotC chaperone)